MSSHAAHTKPTMLRIALALTALVAMLELAGGIAARSLALLADSGHVFMDVVALAIALGAQWQSGRAATPRQTFGFARLEILASLVNAVLLLTVTVFIVIEALHRFAAPELPSGILMIGIALLGGGINTAIGLMLSRCAHADLNVRAALFHVIGDVLGAVSIVIGGIAVLTLRVAWIDPALSLFVSSLIVLGVIHIVREAVDILLESTPAHIDMRKLSAAMRAFAGVVDVHDLHVWTIGARNHALSAHVQLEDKRISEATAVLHDIDLRLRRDFDITHVTVQFECESCGGGEDIVCTQLSKE